MNRCDHSLTYEDYVLLLHGTYAMENAALYLTSDPQKLRCLRALQNKLRATILVLSSVIPDEPAQQG